MNDKRPLRVKSLKIIDHVGILYGTFDGSTIWEIDKVAFGILKMCDGNKTLDEIAQILATRTNLNVEELKETLKEIFDEMEKLKFIEYV
jgi:aminopeptidase-like protein